MPTDGHLFTYLLYFVIALSYKQVESTYNPGRCFTKFQKFGKAECSGAQAEDRRAEPLVTKEDANLKTWSEGLVWRYGTGSFTNP